MDPRRKLEAVKEKLGPVQAEARQKDEYGFFCPSPKCTSAEQGKVRLWVNLTSDIFNCWHCGYSGRNLAPLMRKGSPEMKEYLASRGDQSQQRVVAVERPRCMTLPDGFTPLHRSRPPSSAPYRNYLLNRGLTEEQLGLYRIGYVDEGPLAGRVVVPSFDARGLINFWSARSIYPNETLRYVLPKATKDVVSNEHMIDWTQPVYLVEGIFDEIAIGPQGIALYGKLAFPALLMRLIEHRPPIAYVCLDSDARREAMLLLNKLVGYDIKTALVDLSNKDPGIMGGKAVMEISSECKPVSGSAGLIGMRL